MSSNISSGFLVVDSTNSTFLISFGSCIIAVCVCRTVILATVVALSTQSSFDCSVSALVKKCDSLHESHFLTNAETEQSNEDCVERATTVARMTVLHTQTAIMQEPKDMRNVELVESTTRKPELIFDDILNAISDSPSNLARIDDQEHRVKVEDDEVETELGQ